MGGAKDQARFPRCHGGNATPRAERVGAHSPAGDYSPFGVADLVGSVWQYTDEFVDAHTRRAALRGGSTYCPAAGSCGGGPSPGWRA